MEKSMTTNGVDVTIHYDHPPDIELIKKACIDFMINKKMTPLSEQKKGVK